MSICKRVSAGVAAFLVLAACSGDSARSKSGSSTGNAVTVASFAFAESATLAEQFIHETCLRQGIERGQLTIHADRGSAMTSKPVALLLASPRPILGRTSRTTTRSRRRSSRR